MNDIFKILSLCKKKITLRKHNIKTNVIHFPVQFKNPRLFLQWLANLFPIIHTSTYKTYMCELDVIINDQAPIIRNHAHQ